VNIIIIYFYWNRT